jgi:hypothetical protein
MRAMFGPDEAIWQAARWSVRAPFHFARPARQESWRSEKNAGSRFSLTLKPCIFFPPIRAVAPLFPHYAYHNRKRLQDPLVAHIAAYAFGFLAKFCARDEIQRGCGNPPP